MKRLAAFGLCVALCISLTACRFVDLEPEEFLQAGGSGTVAGTNATDPG